MWGYHSIAAGVKNAARIASVRGAGCANQPCANTIGYYAQMMLSTGVPLASTVTFTSAGGSQTCDPLSDCVNGAAAGVVWPSLSGTIVGSDITISPTFPVSGSAADGDDCWRRYHRVGNFRRCIATNGAFLINIRTNSGAKAILCAAETALIFVTRLA
jgi:hypothetical protein